MIFQLLYKNNIILKAWFTGENNTYVEPKDNEMLKRGHLKCSSQRLQENLDCPEIFFAQSCQTQDK